MSRGIVMETGSTHVIVLMPDGQFRKVRTALKPQVGDEITFAEQRRLQRPRKLYSFSVGAAAIMLMLFIPLFVQHFSKQPDVVAYLTMDVNPSIELGINKDEMVESLRAINADGADVTKGLAYKGRPLPEVTEAIMDRISAGPYLNSGEGDVVITSVAVGGTVKPAEEIGLTSHMDEAVRKSLAKTEKGRQLKIEVTTLSAPQDVRDEATKIGLSSGKMAFYLMAKNQGYRVTIKELKQESLHQAAKPMGGVAAVMGAGKDAKKNDDAKKPDPSATKQQTEQPKPSAPAPSKEAEKEALRQKQKEQLHALLEKDQEKRKERRERDGQKDGDSNKGGKHGGQGNGGKKNSDSDKPNGLQGGFVNIGAPQHSPGNNPGGGGGKKPSAGGKPAQAALNASKPKDDGNSKGNSKGKGGKDEAKNASDGRPSRVTTASAGGKPGSGADRPNAERDKPGNRGNGGSGKSDGQGNDDRDGGNRSQPGQNGGGKNQNQDGGSRGEASKSGDNKNTNRNDHGNDGKSKPGSDDRKGR
ncbi:anti-sigma factor domain-containing protein [Paenibacillus sp. MWE-103]|uniref:Anti-sigma factor domain-containing protein n=1 Tax=Paenibacillus artemisiicola TaxID=1172618 RepID=A0ABS3W8H7_9BACL|nr:anti-sigma factor domain-containing protein [Paenibacillus artemisiicola]MBO7744622.1 anti-sigma factor domain-containing protein [Paenibacillus artemisiicola]